jgi:2-polyprenyl-3-methyl-5-hydroxy-6-metoxy-1,4-benzoquinol methylase
MRDGVSDGMSDGAVLSFFGDRFKRLVRRALGQEAPARAEANAQGHDSPLLRRSSGMREFWKAIEGPPGLKILDLGAASQANVTFITDLGYKLYTADLLQSFQNSGQNGGRAGEASATEESFFRENCNYGEAEFDGILCWDLFDFVADPLIKPLIEKLLQALKPGGTVLSFFHNGAAGQPVPLYQYRIRSVDTLQMTGRGTARLERHFNNRTIENLFKQCASLKFYLSRDSLREVISVR